jgi:hypothetical protein
VLGIDPPRYEPLPGLAELPAWLWRRAGRGARLGAGLLLLALAAFAVALLPGLRDDAREQSEAVQRARAEQRAQLVERLEAEQRPRFARGAAAPATAATNARLAARTALLDDVAGSIAADARARVRRGELDGRVRRVDCEPYPRSVRGHAPHESLARRRGRYSCVAVTAEFAGTEESPGGVIGHQYRVLVDFQTGRYGYCKIAGQSGPSREQLVTTPRACGG